MPGLVNSKGSSPESVVPRLFLTSLRAASKARGSRSGSIAAAPGAAAGAARSASASAAASLAESQSRSLLRHLVGDRDDREDRGKRGEGEEAPLLGSQGVGDIEEGGCEGGEYGEEEDEELDDQVGLGAWAAVGWVGCYPGVRTAARLDNSVVYAMLLAANIRVHAF